jgi:uncharacterized damage-inducible protein DinB
MDARQLLVDTHPHLPPAATLAGITPMDALRRIAGLPHSIAEIVAHMTYWQEWFTARAEGRAEAMPATAAVGWPAVADGDWPAVSDRFVAGLDRLAEVVSAHEPDLPLAPAIEFGLVAGYSYRDVWEHVAQHNAHHLGQVVVLRQILGIWPPPSGSYTW